MIWFGLVATFAGLAGVPAPSASATGGTVFTASVDVQCYGCGSSSGSAQICATGDVNGSAMAGCVYPAPRSALLLAGNVYATFTVFEDPATCPATGTAEGDTTGAITTHFTWTRVGAITVISTPTGDLAGGNGIAALAPTSSLGIPCHATNVRSTAGGALGDPS